MKSLSKWATAILIPLIWATGLSGGSKPNIVVILADDFGYGSANCYGASKSLIRTPHIDQLAKDGMRFTDANTPGSVCTPTRYALLTGRYAWRGRLKYGVLHPAEGGLLIEENILALPAYLQQQGYKTAHIGKWHLGYTNMENVEDLSAQPLIPGPGSVGFDYHFGVPNNIDWLPKVYIENEGIWGLRSKGKSPYGKSSYGGREALLQNQQYHGYDAPQEVATQVTQDLSEVARNWIFKTVRQEPDKPFFLYFAPVAVHHPISPSEKWRGSSGAGAYGDFIHDLDHSTGEIMDALAYSGVLDNTIVIFTSDNGGDIPVGRDEAPEVRAVKMGLKINGDLRGDKHTIWEGGFKVPFVARWPGHIPAGAQSHRMVNLVDLYATFQELVSGEVMAPTKAAPDSFSFYSTLVGTGSDDQHRSTMVVNDVKGIVALRMGDWKYIENKAERPEDKERQVKNPNLVKPELYNLVQDPSEAENVIDRNPGIAAKMQSKLDQIRKEGSERLAAE